MADIFKNTLIILFLTAIFVLPLGVSAVMQSPSYRIDYERISSGGGTEGSDGYNLLETLGEFGAGEFVSDNYKAGSGESFTIKADVSPTPTLLNNGSYNSLNFRINRGWELEGDPALVWHLKFDRDPVFDSYLTSGVASEGISPATKIAERFETGTSTDYISSFDIYQTAGGNLAGNFTIETDNWGQPSGTTVGAGVVNITLSAGLVTQVKLASPTSLTTSNIYWLVFTPISGSGTFQGNTSGEADQVKVYNGSSWSLSANIESLYFQVFDRADDEDDNNPGQILGAVTTGGRYGRALSFDGSNDYVWMSDTSSLDISDTLSLEAWIKPDDMPSSDEYLVYRAGAYYLKITNGLKVVGGVWEGTVWVTASSKNSITGDGSTWTHVVLTYDKDAGGTDEVKVYVDGIKQGAGDNSTAIPASAANLYLGAGDEAHKDDTPENWFDGVIDEVALYSRTLGAPEISRQAQIANPSDSEYAIAISKDNWATLSYIQAEGTTSTAMVWQTYTNWGSGIGKSVVGLSPQTTYQIKVKARQGDFTESEWSRDTSAETSAISLSFSLSANTCDFGNLAVNTISQCETVLEVDTNSDDGYQTTVSENHDIQTSGGASINDVSDGVVNFGEEYGIRTSGSIDGQMSDGDYAISSNLQVVASKSGPALSRQITVTYKIVIDSNTPAGEYSHTVTYITTSTF